MMGGDPFASSAPHPSPRRSSHSHSSPSLRFLGAIGGDIVDRYKDLDERDVLWAPDNDDDGDADFPSSVEEYLRSPPRRQLRERSGLSTALDGEVYRMSAPLKVPAWPTTRRGGGGGEEEEDEEEEMVPPHVVVARRWREDAAASFSVFEGAGRTLKGRDLRTVRNAVLRKTGFLD